LCPIIADGLHGLGVYADQECTIPLTSLSYALEPGANTTPYKTIWVKNFGSETLYISVTSTAISGLTHHYQPSDLVAQEDKPKGINANSVQEMRSWFEKTGEPTIGTVNITITVNGDTNSS
jgi:hypothetical protein